MAKKLTVSIIIPNYDGAELLRRNLPKVIAGAGKRCQEIIVVDDGSTDDSIKIMQSAYWRTKLKIIKNKKNLGFASTVNRGVRAAKGEIVVLLNTDVYP